MQEVDQPFPPRSARPVYQLHFYERQLQRDSAGGVTNEQFNYLKAVTFSLSARWYPMAISADRARLRHDAPL